MLPSLPGATVKHGVRRELLLRASRLEEEEEEGWEKRCPAVGAVHAERVGSVNRRRPNV